MPLRIAVLGTGLMGAGIAAAAAKAGHRVTVTSSPRTPPDVALARVGRDDVGWSASTAEAATGADLVIEALPEQLALKQRELAAAEAAAPAAVLGTNTSSLRIAEIASALRDPGRLVGTHFVNPPLAFDLVELVESELSDPAVVARAEAMLEELGKRPVRIHRDVPGFVFNRLQFALLREAIALVDEGVVDARDLDRIVTDGVGRRWAAAGPLASVELGGAELFHRIAGELYPHLATRAQPPGTMARLGLDRDALEALRSRRAQLVRALAAVSDGIPTGALSLAVDHVGVVVADLDAAGRFLVDVLGLDLRARLDWPELGFTTAFYRCGGAEIELIEIHDAAMREARLGKDVARVEHVALRTDDLAATAATLARAGVVLRGVATPTGHRDGPFVVGDRANLWSDPATTAGIQLQLVEDRSLR